MQSSLNSLNPYSLNITYYLNNSSTAHEYSYLFSLERTFTLVSKVTHLSSSMRFHGKSPGHIHSILNSLAKNKPMPPNTSYCPMINNTQTSNISNKNTVEDSSKKDVENNESTHLKLMKDYVDTFIKSTISTKTNKDQQVLAIAEKAGLSVYEDTNEFSSAGAVKLSKTGYDLNKILNNTNNNLKDFTFPEEINFEGGLINIDPKTLIPNATQMHLGIFFLDQTSNTYKLVGFLTSENNVQTIQLSTNQPISGNEKKAQCSYISPIITAINRSDFQPMPLATRYLQDPAIKTKMLDAFNDRKKVTPFKESNNSYNTIGLTTEQLLALIDKKNQQDCLPKKLKPTNQEQKAFAIEKAAKAHKKMLENQEKQKAAAEKNKKDKNS